MSESVPYVLFDWQLEFTLAPDVVLEFWRDHIGAAAPWRTMPPDDVAGYLRPMVVALLGAERDPDERRRVLALHDAAVRHAEFRRSQCCDRRTLSHELAALEAAIGAAAEHLDIDPICADLLASIARAELRRVRRSVRRVFRRR